MKLARAVVLSVPVVIALSACSDPPAAPAEGAVSITVNTSPGMACPQVSGTITAPPDPAGSPNAVNSSLQCSLLSAGCNPRSYLVTDGDNGAAVGCTVAPQGNQWAFSVALVTSPRMSFRASGTISATGGTVQLTQSGANFVGNALTDTACKIDILPNLGHIEKGAIWARFSCSQFKDPNAAGGDACIAEGSFYFDHCGS